MDYNSEEGKEVLKHPLIELKGKKKDFILNLFLKIAYKKSKAIIYYQKEEISRLKKREINQTEEINRLQHINKVNKEEINALKKRI